MVDAMNMLRSTGSAHQKSLYSGFSLIPIAMLMAKNARFSSTLVTCQFRLEVAYRSSATIAAGGLLATAFKFVAITIRVRTEPSKPSNVLEFVFSVQVPSIVLEFNSMFSNVLETKCLENAVILAVYWRKELNKFAHPTTSGKKRRDPNSCRTNARQPSASCDAHFARRSGAEAQTANGCVRHKLSFGRVQLHGNSAPNDHGVLIIMTCAFVSHFRPCCVRWICVEF